jgi:hypothetical protein
MELEDILERVTRSEEVQKAATLRSDERHTESMRFMSSVDDRIGSLEKALAKYTGFWGAIMLVGSAIATALMLFKEFFARKFGMGS